MEYGFYAAVSRMKYIERWALMRNSRSENLSEHSMEVAMLAHALCLIGNARYGKKLNADRAAVIGLFMMQQKSSPATCRHPSSTITKRSVRLLEK